MFACRIGNAIVSAKITPTTDLATIYMYFVWRKNTLDTFVSYESRVGSRLKRDCPYNEYIMFLCPDKLRTGRFCPVLISLFSYYHIMCDSIVQQPYLLLILSLQLIHSFIFILLSLVIALLFFLLMPKCKYTFTASLQCQLSFLGKCRKIGKVFGIVC